MHRRTCFPLGLRIGDIRNVEQRWFDGNGGVRFIAHFGIDDVFAPGCIYDKQAGRSKRNHITSIQADYGVDFVLSKNDGGLYGDFQTMALMDDSVHAQLGLDLGAGGGGLAEDFESVWDEYDFDYVGSGLVQAGPGTLAEKSGLAGVANPSGAGENWFGYWQIGRNPEDNPYESTANFDYSLSGSYILFCHYTYMWGG